MLQPYFKFLFIYLLTTDFSRLVSIVQLTELMISECRLPSTVIMALEYS